MSGFRRIYRTPLQSWPIRLPDGFVTQICTGFIGSLVGGDDLGDSKMDFKVAAAGYAGREGECGFAVCADGVGLYFAEYCNAITFLAVMST